VVEAEHLLTGIAGERQEIELLAIVLGAVAAEIRKFHRLIIVVVALAEG
jgi:hypothetical protein